MTEVTLTLVPVFLVILTGYGVRRFRLLDDGFWVSAEKITYYALFPALLVTTTAGAEFGELPVAAVAATMMVGSTVSPALLIALRGRIGLPDPTFTSLLQGAIRPNTYIGLAASFALAGNDGLALVAVCVVVNIPLVNLWSVLALAKFAGSGGASVSGWRIIVPIARNPLILACLLGGALNASGIGLPIIVKPYLEILGRASLPIALLAVGAGLDFAAVRNRLGTTAFAGGLKLLVLPLVAFGMALALGIDGTARMVLVLFAALPVSASSYVLARQMGGDAPVMAGIITASTIAAMVSMPLMIGFLT